MVENLDLKFLKRAVELSRKSLEAGGFPVAALLVRGTEEISYGLSCTEVSHDVTAHGEIQAIRAAGRKAIAPLTLYSPLEPCMMCLAASAWAGVTKIIYGCKRTSVDASYYINFCDAQEMVKILVVPPELIFVEEFGNEEILFLISQYEARKNASSD